jgi:hypothetical protein
MVRSAWDIAYHAGRRVFYESATDTVRQCPENYCILARLDGSTWSLYLDAAAPINPHALSIVMDGGWRNETNGATVATMLEDAFWGSR